MEPSARSSPELMKKVPSGWNPASAAAGPTVGANCRGVSKTDAMGMANFGADGRWRLRGGIVRVAAHTKK